MFWDGRVSILRDFSCICTNCTAAIPYHTSNTCSELPKSTIEQKEENEHTVCGIPSKTATRKVQAHGAGRQTPCYCSADSVRDEEKSTLISQDPSPSGHDGDAASVQYLYRHTYIKHLSIMLIHSKRFA